MLRLPLLVLLTGCFGDVHQVAGTGALYTTKCSARMEARADGYFAPCAAPDCAPRFRSVAENHVIVAVEPGEKVLGYRERVCVQDLSEATALFRPIQEPPPDDAPAEEGKAP